MIYNLKIQNKLRTFKHLSSILGVLHPSQDDSLDFFLNHWIYFGETWMTLSAEQLGEMRILKHLIGVFQLLL